MRLLVLGGTKFLGRAVVEAALAAGHHVTLFNRSFTNPQLYPVAEKLRGDLESNLGALRGHSWDAAVDLDATTVPRRVRRYGELLVDAVGHFVFVSSLSVYADPSLPLGESSPLHEPPEPEPETFQDEQYAGLKIGCEGTVQDIFGETAAVVVPG